MNDPRAIVPVKLTKRLTQAMTYGLTGGWFSPQLPLLPQHQETAGRRFDYLTGYNISTRPRRDSGIDFYTLRNFAKYYDLMRILIEKRKDQISNFEWSIVPSDEAVDAGKDIDELQKLADAATKFMKFPDGRQKWNTWLRQVVEDMLVLDAIALWPVYKGNQLLRLETVDPSTIKLVIDESGRTPEKPYPAYQQVLHGVPTADFLKDELLYFISNPASDRIYGLSKVEQILVTVQMGLRREMSQLQFFTDGNVPAALAGVPDNWNMTQISQLQNAFDDALAGNTAARRKIWFVPSETAKYMKEFKPAEALLKAEFDEWLMRIMCFNFGIAPSAFTKQVNRATAFSAQEEARDDGLGPQLTFIKSLIDTIIVQALKYEGVEFKWSIEEENDPSTQAEIDDKMVRNGTRSIDELRQRDGLEPLGIGPMLVLASGPVLIQDIVDGKVPVPGTNPAGPDDPNAPPGAQKGAPGSPQGPKNAPPKGNGGTPPKSTAPGAHKPSKAKESGKNPSQKDGKVSADEKPDAPLKAKTKVKKHDHSHREVSAGSALPFRKGGKTFRYVGEAFHSPKGSAAQARLIKASQRSRDSDN